MIRKEINEIKNLFTIEECNIKRLRGCYVDGDKNKITSIDELFLNLPEEEQHKYFEIFRKCLTGTPGRNLVEMEFTENAIKEGNARDKLFCLRDCELSDDKVLESFYDKVIESFDYVGNYIILVVNQTYDIPLITEDNLELDDASEEVFNYILCCICPVNLSKPGLSYDEKENNFHNNDRSYMVELPELGFLFPAFNLRSEDTDRILLYSKNTDEFHNGFIDTILDCRIPMPATAQKETFQNIVAETLGDDCNIETVKNIHENLTDMIQEKKNSYEPPALDKEEVKAIFERSGVSSEKIQSFEENFEKHFENEAVEEQKFLAANILPGKKFEIKTPDVVVKINSDKTDLVETTFIEGNQYLLIRIDEGLEVNGIPVGGGRE